MRKNLSAMVLVLLVGCMRQGPANTDSPFDRYGGRKVGEPSPPESLTLTEPPDGTKFRPGETITCVLRVVAPRREQVPTILHVTLWDQKDRGRMGMKYSEPTGDPVDGRYEFKTTFVAPARPGTYRIHADGVDYVQSESEGEAPKVVETGSHDIHIRVRAR